MRDVARHAELVGALTLGAAPVAGLGLAGGGFNARTWGWATLGLSGAAIVTALVRRPPAVPPRLVALLGFLAALVVWTAASLSWSRSAASTVPELQRLLVYLAVLGAAVLLVRARNGQALVVGIFLGVAGVVVWGLVSYLLAREAALDPFQGALLHQPLGYANAMGVVAVLALLLGLGLVLDARARWALVATRAALVPLAASLALTGSRASWAALLAGLGVATALTADRRAAMRVWAHALVLPAVAVVAVVLSDVSRSDVLGARADRLGERVLVALVALTALAALPTLVGARAAARRRGPALTRSRSAALPAAVVLGTVGLIATAALTPLGGERSLYWRVALDEFRERPLLGSGAGTYAQAWLEHRTVSTSVRDAHSLPLESLAELGLVGFAAVVLLLGAPLAWGVAARTRPLTPAVTGAFGAFAVHASVDWDWELPAIAIAGLLLACALAVAAAGDGRVLLVSPPVRAGAALAAALAASLALCGIVGSRALDEATRALARGDAGEAVRTARRAQHWQPWSAEPLLLGGRAHLALGEAGPARALFFRAVRRDPGDYRVWMALAAVSREEKAEAALSRARSLNPRAIRLLSGP